MTIHFKANFKNKANSYVVPYCTMWAMSPKSGATTEIKEEVSCTRCAKQLDITPAAKKVTGSKSGTCQCCFNSQKLPKGKLSHHGYKAPGHGYHVGECRGQHELPFELSCEVTKTWRAEVASWLESTRRRLVALENNEVESFPYSLTDYEAARIGGPYGERPIILVTVKKGEEAVYTYPGQRISHGTPSFESLRKSAIRNTKQSIEGGEAQLKFLDGKIASWKLVDGF